MKRKAYVLHILRIKNIPSRGRAMLAHPLVGKLHGIYRSNFDLLKIYTSADISLTQGKGLVQ